MFNWSISNYITPALAALLVVSNGVWFIAWDHQRDKYTNEYNAHNKTILNYEKAQIEAALIDTEKARAKEKEDFQKAQKADERTEYWRSQYNAALLRYQKSQRTPSTINLSSTTVTSDGDYQSSDSTEISISISDANICADNTARLMSIYEWSKTYGR